MASGARKFDLNRRLFEIKQNGRVVAEYYTDMKAVWEELDALTLHPTITQPNAETTAYVESVRKHHEELKLFQFLDGIDEMYHSQRSQILLMSPLPTVEEACNIIQQEESQRAVFRQGKREDSSIMAMFGKKTDLKCSNYGKAGHTQDKCLACKICGKNGHTMEDCWHAKGYPNKGDKGKANLNAGRPQNFKGRDSGNKEQPYKGGQRWDKERQGAGRGWLVMLLFKVNQLVGQVQDLPSLPNN